jgi:hypothetical protein
MSAPSFAFCGYYTKIPAARVLKTEGEQKDDNEEIAAAIKMAILLLSLGDAMEERIEATIPEDVDSNIVIIWPSSAERLQFGVGQKAIRLRQRSETSTLKNADEASPFLMSNETVASSALAWTFAPATAS